MSWRGQTTTGRSTGEQRSKAMATYAIDTFFRFVSGTTDADTFNISADNCTASGLAGNDAFRIMPGHVGHFLDGASGHDTFTFGAVNSFNTVRGGDGNDVV